MRKAVLASVLVASLLAACGGGGGSDGGSNAAASTSAMAGAFSTEITTIKACIQGEIDGKAACGINFLQDPITRMCSDVRTGRPNQFTGADYAKFTPTCDTWAGVLQSDAAGKIAKLDQMATQVDALK